MGSRLASVDHGWLTTLPASQSVLRARRVSSKVCPSLLYMRDLSQRLKQCEGYSGIPANAQYRDDERSPPLLSEKSPSSSSQAWTLPPRQSNVYPYDEANPAHLMPNYPTIQPTQPTSVQPSTRREGMVYPVKSSLEEFPDPAPTPAMPASSQDKSTAPDRGDAQYPPTSRFERHESDASQYPSSVSLSSPVNEKSFPRPDSHTVSMMTSYQKAPVSKRGPFKNNEVREQTAETRRIGSCIRCRMQRIRVSPHCLTRSV